MRDLLVRARDRLHWNYAVSYAADLAARLRASLTGVHVVARDAENGTPDEAAATRFESWARSIGVTSASWQIVRGDVDTALARLSLWHDAIILDRDPQDPAASVQELGAIAIASEARVILVPHRRRAADLRCVALAWNHSPEALKAIHAARPLIERASRVLLLEGGARHPRSEQGWLPPFDIEQLLARFGVHAERHAIHGESSAAGEMIVKAARRERADLLVMGAYGRSRLSEWALGGATRTVLADASLPILLKH